jgi:hypothetical protein
MIEAGAWDGIGSSIVGGLIGALTVVLGGWVGYRFAARARKAENKGRRSDARRRAADKLIVEISNLRDAATRSRRSYSGDYDLYLLRNELYLARSYLDTLPAYDQAWKFYDIVKAFRDHMRGTPLDVTGTGGSERRKVVDQYREALDAYGEKVLKLLQFHLEDEVVQVPTPPAQLDGW